MAEKRVQTILEDERSKANTKHQIRPITAVTAVVFKIRKPENSLNSL